MRAAQYVRMSTEGQEYSIANQKAAIQAYAASHQFEIVRTYADPAKSGLDIKHRPGLQALIDDVVGGNADFKVVLVFDVSRWGRFQDSDEAACYEFLCKRAGIAIHYCAEPFTNDGTLVSSFLKMVKRTMAAEYLRELSAKVHVGQCRLAAKGYKMGGRPRLGLRRLLLDSEGRPKMVLKYGERKNLANERVVCTLGPAKEVALVRKIYSMFLDDGLPVRTIARVLKQRAVKRGQSTYWDHNIVRRLLTDPQYCGCAVFNRRSEKLRSKRVANPREQWVLHPNAFPAIISRERFERAQQKFGNMVFRRSDERLLEELKEFLESQDRPLPFNGGAVPGMACASTYERRFGSMAAAYARINHPGFLGGNEALIRRRVTAGLRTQMVQDLGREMAAARIDFVITERVFQVPGGPSLLPETARCFSTPHGHLRWEVRTWRGKPRHWLLVMRLQPGNSAVMDYVIIRKIPKVRRDFTLDDELAQGIGKIYTSIGEIAKYVAASRVAD